MFGLDSNQLTALVHYFRVVGYFAAATFCFDLSLHMRRIRFFPLAIGIFMIPAGTAALFLAHGQEAARDLVVTWVVGPAIWGVAIVSAWALVTVSRNP